MPREGSFALASFGRLRKLQEPAFAVAAGRKSFALKRSLEAVFVILVTDASQPGHEPGPNAVRGGIG